MTDGVARELEQAEARLVEAREEAWDASRRLLDAAIEVGRLRALAVTDADVERVAEALFRHEWAKAPTLAPSWLAESHSPELRVYWIECALAAIAALAVREEVQG